MKEGRAIPGQRESQKVGRGTNMDKVSKHHEAHGVSEALDKCLLDEAMDTSE